MIIGKVSEDTKHFRQIDLSGGYQSLNLSLVTTKFLIFFHKMFSIHILYLFLLFVPITRSNTFVCTCECCQSMGCRPETVGTIIISNCTLCQSECINTFDACEAMQGNGDISIACQPISSSVKKPASDEM